MRRFSAILLAYIQGERGPYGELTNEEGKVYGLLTLILALVYARLVFGGEAVLVGIIGQSNGIVIVGSTLIVAVLFQPLRQRIQALIDRRFYRRKYDAARISEY